MKAVLVTGAGYGIGRCIAETFARHGWRVAATDRNVEGLRETESALPEGSLCLPIDILADGAPESLVSATIAAFGRLDCIVNNAADQTPGGLADTETATWDRVMGVNLRAPFLLARAALPHLKASRGCIVNMGSLVGNQPLPDRLAYSVSKAGIAGLTRALATDLGPEGIRVNAVAPGHIMSEGIERWRERNSPRDQAIFPTAYPLARVGFPEEVAEAVVFLASDAAGFVTGATLPVDGGMSVLCPETAVFRAANLI